MFRYVDISKISSSFITACQISWILI